MKKTKNCAARFKTDGDGLEDGQFEAIVSVFGNVDSVGDRVVKGAFEKTLSDWKASGDPIPVIWSHRWLDPDYHIGYVLDAEERDEGLWVRGQLDLESPKAAQVHRLLKGRRVTQFSFAYDVLDEKSADDANELTELKLFEVGPTLIGANQETELLAAKADVKRGRVLSQKNEQKLRDARKLIDEVLSQLGEEDPKDDPAKSGPGSEPETDEEPLAKSETSHALTPASYLTVLELEAQATA